MKVNIFIVISQLSKILAVVNFHPHIRYPGGTLKGETGKSLSGRDFYKFWCIPYGKAERFEPSVPADPWEGVRDATYCSQRCPMAGVMGLNDMFMEPPQDEDCLILNVFIPAKPQSKNALLPVLVYVHGGYFVMGSSLDYSSEIFLDEDIVLVTINYRLGALGFLTSGDGILEANLGMKDQVLSLEWVKTFIHHFGGDPNRVTIMGESAGAASIGLLLLSPIANGLFNQAIAHSGSAMVPFAIQSNPAETFKGFVTELNCTAPSTEEAVTCLKSKDIQEIRAVVEKTKWFVEFLYPMFPAVETVSTKNSRNFLPKHPREMLKGGYFSHVPLIIGVNEDEGALQGGFAIGDSEFMEDLNIRWIPLGGVAAGVDSKNVSKANLNAGLMKLRKYYFGDDTIELRHAQQLVDMFSDCWFVSGLDFTIRHHSKYAPVYPYIFTKKGAFQISGALVGQVLNRSVVSHAEELQYLFYKGFASSKKDLLFAERFLKLWTSFIATGIPSETWGSEKIWPSAEKSSWDYKYYVLDDDTKIVQNPYKERARFHYDLDENEWSEKHK
ncbi:unnamed protein product [Allacma fusca]|uniref:Carboxylic ester hydrolase n=1 Tax=Allacma fusca TaxID=39272 RepID=A0A8J2JXC7_9HEXA|nr:unnamed protein product [Allacma fusca]